MNYYQEIKEYEKFQTNRIEGVQFWLVSLCLGYGKTKLYRLIFEVLNCNYLKIVSFSWQVKQLVSNKIKQLTGICAIMFGYLYSNTVHVWKRTCIFVWYQLIDSVTYCRWPSGSYKVHSIVDAQRIWQGHIPPTSAVAANQVYWWQCGDQSMACLGYQNQEEGRWQEEKRSRSLCIKFPNFAKDLLS